MAELKCSPSRRSSTRARTSTMPPPSSPPGPGVPVGDHQALPMASSSWHEPRGRPGARPEATRQHVLGGHPTQLVEADRHVSGSPTTSGGSWTNFNIGVSLPTGLTRRNRCLVNLEGTSRPSEIADPQLLVITRDITQPRQTATPISRGVAGNKTARNGSAPTSPRSSAPHPRTCGHRGSILASTQGNTATRSASSPIYSEARASPFPVTEPPAAVDRATADPMSGDLLTADMDMAVLDASASERGVAPRG